MPDYNFIIKTDMPTEAIPSGLPAALPDGKIAGGAGAMTSGANIQQAIYDKTMNKASQIMISPLNNITGGLATPIYGAGRALAKGAGAGAVAGAGVQIAFAVARLVSEAIKKEKEKNATKAEQMSNADNALLRAGSVATATFYESSTFKVRKINRG